MSYTITYHILFELKILHRYFLDKGVRKFELLAADKQADQLTGYTLDTLMDVAPTPETISLLQGHQLIFKKTQHGMLVAAKTDDSDASFPFIRLDPRLTLSFFMRVKDPLFYNYTELPLDLSSKQLWVTNGQIGDASGSYPSLKKDGSFFLINEQVLVPRQEGITEPAIGLIKLMLHTGNDDTDIMDDQGRLALPHPVFIALFENRRTHWRYVFPRDQDDNPDALVKENGDAKRWITKNKQPLTQTGFISLKMNGKELPNPTASMIKPDKATQLIYSETYM